MLSNAPRTATDRLTIHTLSTAAPAVFAEDVRAGLSANPKTLLPRYFYDDLGSRLFEAICCLPEYYLTRAETEYLRARSLEIIHRIAGPRGAALRIVELGSGSAEKTRFLFDAAFEQQDAMEYVSIDISGDSLRRSSEKLLTDYPNLTITGYQSDYYRALERLSSPEAGPSLEKTVVLFLGSSIGNLNPAESLELFARVRRLIGPGDAFLLGADLKKSSEVLIPAYQDALGVTAAFNLNLLVRINRELGGNFELAGFRHEARYSEEFGRIEMHLVSRRNQQVRIDNLNLDLTFEEGESIHTENSHKFDSGQLAEMARAAGFKLEQTWFDSNRLFGFHMFIQS